jgi:16S rRNA pseudouridine516 synthase
MATRLDAFLAHRGFGTRSDVRQLIRSGRVTVDDAVCRQPATHILAQRIGVQGQEVAAGPTVATLLVHKPIGLACSHDAAEAPLLSDLIPERYRHLPMRSAGRLDRDTSGLIIVSSRGPLIHALTHPRHAIGKRYRIRYRGALHRRAVERCAAGLRLDDDPEPTLPAWLEVEEVATATGLGRATLVIFEGRYHQVRRMIAQLGGEVVALHRDRIGDLELPLDLAGGQLRELTPDEEAAALRPGSMPGPARSAARTAPLPPPAADA